MNLRAKTASSVILACSVSCLSFVIPQNKAEALVISSGRFSDGNTFNITNQHNVPKTVFMPGETIFFQYSVPFGIGPGPVFYASGDNSGENDMGNVNPIFPTRMLFNGVQVDQKAFEFTTPVEPGETFLDKVGIGLPPGGLRILGLQDLGVFPIEVELFSPGEPPSLLARASTTVLVISEPPEAIFIEDERLIHSQAIGTVINGGSGFQYDFLTYIIQAREQDVTGGIFLQNVWQSRDFFFNVANAGNYNIIISGSTTLTMTNKNGEMTAGTASLTVEGSIDRGDEGIDRVIFNSDMGQSRTVSWGPPNNPTPGQVNLDVGNYKLKMGSTIYWMPNDAGDTLAVNSEYGITVVPEPLTILGAGTAAGFGAFFKRELNKSKKKQKDSESA